jgi:UDP-N-acetylglucosamine--N-acetylmuramyl-(pentapeptide) pyrophosphoryl-undecaprenol N-acetylglucosamine transferase
MKAMKRTIMIAGGGTGGHIYPGLAIAKALQKLDPNLEIRFVGSAQGLETKIIPQEKFPLHLIAGGKFNFSGQILQKFKTLMKLPWGFLQSVVLILQIRPLFVLGVGGYASAPFVLAAALMGRKTAIWEANVHPGMANRWLANFVDHCFVVFEESKGSFPQHKVEVFGMPVRAEMESQSEPAPRTDSKFHLLHYGGSRGSRAIGRALNSALLSDPEWAHEMKVVHQTGSLDYSDFVERYKGLEDVVSLHEFIYNMPDYYRWADGVLCRGGASTLNELAAFGLPAIIVPLPAADAHQERNAEMLVQAQAARMILQKDLSPQRLVDEIRHLISDAALRENLQTKIRQFHRHKAAEAIAKAILES